MLAATDVIALAPEWISPDFLVGLGVLAILAVVFVETGLLIGFFLPGDSLLFTAGLLVARGTLDVPLWVLLVTIPIAAILGDQVGYQIGRTAGPRIFNKPDSRLFRQEYVDKAYGFFETYGARTIVIARFVPIVRTFAPVCAGVSRMDRRVFTTYNVLGAVLWGAGVTALGYYLGQFAFVADNLEVMILCFVALAVVPIAVEVLRARRTPRTRPPAEGRELPADVPTD